MLELIVFVLAFGADWLVKHWSMQVLSKMPGASVELIKGVFWLQYAENDGRDVSWIRDPRNPYMIAFRVFLIALILILLIRYRKKVLKPITRVGLVLFLAGMIGNQVNYLVMGFVPDMFAIAPIAAIFNVADVLVVISMCILFLRFAFFEGQIFVNWMIDNMKPPEHRKRRRRSQSQKALPAPKAWTDSDPLPNRVVPPGHRFADIPEEASTENRPHTVAAAPAPETAQREPDPKPRSAKPRMEPQPRRNGDVALPPGWPSHFPPPRGEY